MAATTKKILYCDSKGDKRFSAFYAQITIGGETHSIEYWYQNSKRTELNQIPGKGNPVAHIEWFGQTYSVEYLSKLYKNLWKLYFIQHPDLLKEIADYDMFVDRFKGHAVNNQGDTIAEIVKEYKQQKEK